MTTTEIILLVTTVIFAISSQIYKGQRDDLAAWAVHMHPELFPEMNDETPDEPTGSGSNSAG